MDPTENTDVDFVSQTHTIYAEGWLKYPHIHRAWRQAELEPLVLREHCMMLAVDNKPDRAQKHYMAAGFEVFWKYYEGICARAALAMEFLMREQQRPDFDLQNAQLSRVKAAINTAACYELTVPGRACHIPFDIEYYRNGYNLRPFDELVDILLGLLSILLQEYYDILEAHKRWKEVWTDSSNDEKISRHLVIILPDNTKMFDMLHCGALMRRLACLAVREYGEPLNNPLFVAGSDGLREDFIASNDTLVTFWDQSIYTRWRVLRMVGSSKSGKYRLFKPFFYSFQENMSPDHIEILQFPASYKAHASAQSYCGTYKDITREFFMNTLVHAPCNDPELTKILIAREPDGRECMSTTLLPIYRGRRFYLQSHMVLKAGSLTTPTNVNDVSTMHLRHNHQNHNDANIHAAQDRTTHGGDDWVKYSYRDRKSDGKLEILSSTTMMTCLLLDACDALVDSLNLSTEFNSGNLASQRAVDMAQYYWINKSSNVAKVQVRHHFCPISNSKHENNHMCYLLELQPRFHTLPQYRPSCYKCRSGYQDFRPLPFWDEQWNEQLQRAEKCLIEQFERPAYNYFGFLATALWSESTNQSSSEDEDE